MTRPLVPLFGPTHRPDVVQRFRRGFALAWQRLPPRVERVIVRHPPRVHLVRSLPGRVAECHPRGVIRFAWPTLDSLDEPWAVHVILHELAHWYRWCAGLWDAEATMQTEEAAVDRLTRRWYSAALRRRRERQGQAEPSADSAPPDAADAD